MRFAIHALNLLTLISSSVAYEVHISNGIFPYEVCSGMWGSGDTFINITFDTQYSSGKLDLMIFETTDYRHIGRPRYSSERYKLTYCSEWDFKQGDCSEEERGHFILNLKDGVTLSDTSIWTARLVFHPPGHDAEHARPLNPSERDARLILSSLRRDNQSSIPIPSIKYRDPIHYPVRKDGYYCVVRNPVHIPSPGTWPIHDGTVLFQNAFAGKLPAAEYSKLVFYATMFSLTTLGTLVWTLAYQEKRNHVLPIQKGFCYLIGMVELDMLIALARLTFTNEHGQGTASASIQFVAEIVHAGRGTLTLLVMLLLCRGYSILHDDEAPKPFTTKLKWLFSLHFLSGALFASGKVLDLEYPERVTQLFEFTTAQQLKCSLIVLVPITFSILCGILVSWIRTLRSISLRGQRTIRRKYMYTGGIFFLAVVVYLILRIYTIYGYETRDYYPYFEADDWQLVWLTDGPGGRRELPYFPAFVAIVTIWRPSERLGTMITYEEIPQAEQAMPTTPEATSGQGGQAVVNNGTAD